MPGLIVHEWAERSGGAEKVLDQLLAAFPDAGLRVLWNDAPERFGARASETWLARTPLRRHKALALPFMLPTWRAQRASVGYDWMLASVHLFAHHARLGGVNAGIPRLAYVHTPARYIWSPEYDPRGSGAAVRAVAPALKRIDRARAGELTAIAANSAFVAKRVADAWDRDAEVIHPPVDVARLTSRADWRDALTGDDLTRWEALPAEYILGASRFVPYKRLDLVIEAGERAGIPVVIAGRGPDEEALREKARGARVPVHVVVSPSDELLYTLHQHAVAFVFPAIEDFGIVPVEAQALGTPVVTGPLGGQTESFTPGVSGVLAASTDPVDLASAVEEARGLPAFDGAATTVRFGNDVFLARIRDFVARATA